MTPYLPGPYVLDLTYFVQTREHHVRFNLDIPFEPDPGQPFDEIVCRTKSGGSRSLNLAVNAFVTLWAQFMSDADSSMEKAELYKWIGVGYELQWLSEYTIGEPGESIGATVPASQIILTLRSENGSTGRFTLMDTTTPPGNPYALGLLPGSWSDVVDWLTDDDAVAIARDNGSFIGVIGAFPGQNERLFKAIYRS